MTDAEKLKEYIDTLRERVAKETNYKEKKKLNDSIDNLQWIISQL